MKLVFYILNFSVFAVAGQELTEECVCERYQRLAEREYRKLEKTILLKHVIEKEAISKTYYKANASAVFIKGLRSSLKHLAEMKKRRFKHQFFKKTDSCYTF